jgi:sucrose-phosphate synthase
MLACDIDGTLLHETDPSQPGLAGLKEILAARGDSFVFALASGRSLKLVQEAIAEHDLPEPDLVISSVGAEIYYGSNADLVDKAWQQHIAVHWDRDAIEHAALALPGLDLQEESAQRHHKISFYLQDPALGEDEIYRSLGDLAAHVRVILSRQSLVDILPRRASKGRALRYICQEWNLPLHQTLVCGDSRNDLDMFQTSALGIVVGNAETGLVRNLANAPDIYFARRESAQGILEGLKHFRFPTPAG